MNSLYIAYAALAVNVLTLAFTAWMIYHFRKQQVVDVPATVMVLNMVILGVLIAQIVYFHRGNLIQAASFAVTLLVQSVVALAVQGFIIFQFLKDQPFWINTVESILLAALFGLFVAQLVIVNRYKKKLQRQAEEEY